MFSELITDLVNAAAYGAVGIALLAAGFVVVDALTPGRLGKLICDDRNLNAAIVAASGQLALGVIITTAIWSAHGELGTGLARAGGYGAVGIALLAVSFVVVDALTPGRLGEHVTDRVFHPAVLLTAATHLAVGAVVAASLA